MLQRDRFFAVLLIAVSILVSAVVTSPDAAGDDRKFVYDRYRIVRRGIDEERIDGVNRFDASHRDDGRGRGGVCSSCVDRQLYLNFTKEEIRNDILRKLDMAAPPNVSARDVVPERLVRELLRKYRKDLDVMNDEPHRAAAEDDDDRFKTKEINVLAQNPVGILPADLTDLWDVQYFSFSSIPQLMNDRWKLLRNAKIHVHLPKSPSPGGGVDSEAWIHLFYVQVTKNGEASLTQSKATRVMMFPDRGGWVDIDVREILDVWFKYPEENFGLVVNAVAKSGRRIPVGVQHQKSNAPYLQLEIDDSAYRSRTKRNTANKVCSEENDRGEERCCLWPFTVDFEVEYGWTFIIYPTRYEANYCSGNCTLGVMMPTNPYAHLVQQSKGNPCCTPQKMSGINMLYLDENHNVVLGQLPKMRVERCGCA